MNMIMIILICIYRYIHLCVTESYVVIVIYCNILQFSGNVGFVFSWFLLARICHLWLSPTLILRHHNGLLQILC